MDDGERKKYVKQNSLESICLPEIIGLKEDHLKWSTFR